MNPPDASGSRNPVLYATFCEGSRFAAFARVYRYPPALRVVGLFGSMLAGAIVLGATLAEIEAADPLDLVLHVIGGLVGAAIAWLGLELGLRRIALTPEGIATRLVRWEEVRDVRDVRAGPLGTLLIVSKRRSLIVVWPFLEEFGELRDALLESLRSRSFKAAQKEIG